MSHKIDVVYTWVDDSLPGYKDLLLAHASNPRDANPNRTRDNLDLLKYSLRSLDRYASFVRRIYVLTCRPQVPAWLDTAHPRLRIVHHDEIMPAAILPTFNSFAVVSHLHLLPGLTERFLYLEDDMLIAAPLALSNLCAEDGRPLVWTRRQRTPTRARLDPARSSPWNLALATANAALARELGTARHAYIIHGPRLIDRRSYQAMVDRFPREFAATRASRFRADGNVPGEYLYPHYLLALGQAVAASRAESRWMEGYASLENFAHWTWAQLAFLEWRRPRTITLNDSFGDCPNPRVVRLVRSRLERWLPAPSAYEKGAALQA